MNGMHENKMHAKLKTVKIGVGKKCMYSFINLNDKTVSTIKNLSAQSRVKGRKQMLYLMMHSTHFIYGYMASDMVKDHSDSETGNPLLPHGLLFPISSKSSFIYTIPDRIAYTMAFVKPVVEYWLEQDSQRRVYGKAMNAPMIHHQVH